MQQIEPGQKARSPTRLMSMITLVTVILALAIPSVAVAKKCDNPPCSQGGGDPDYMVAITSGPFQFGLAPVSINRKGNLVGTEPIIINRPPDGDWDEQSAWDAVMETCGGPLGQVSSIGVDADDWSVYKNSPTMIGINLETIYLPNSGPITKEIQIILRSYTPGDDFLPGPNDEEPTVFPLDQYVIWGKPKGGGHSGWETCFQSDSEEVDPLPPPADYPWEFILKISLP